MNLIKRILSWINEPQPTLCCPDPELHDRNNEARHGEVIYTALNADSVGISLMSSQTPIASLVLAFLSLHFLTIKALQVRSYYEIIATW